MSLLQQVLDEVVDVYATASASTIEKDGKGVSSSLANPGYSVLYYCIALVLSVIAGIVFILTCVRRNNMLALSSTNNIIVILSKIN